MAWAQITLQEDEETGALDLSLAFDPPLQDDDTASPVSYILAVEAVETIFRALEEEGWTDEDMEDGYCTDLLEDTFL